MATFLGAKVLIVLDEHEKRQYRNLAFDNIVFADKTHLLEGLRIDEAYYTDRALHSPWWDEVKWRLMHNLVLHPTYYKNPMGRIRNIEFYREF